MSAPRICRRESDNPNALHGIYLDGVVLDECADMDPRVWSESIRPALAARAGWAVFIGTPEGRNAFFDCGTARNLTKNGSPPCSGQATPASFRPASSSSPSAISAKSSAGSALLSSAAVNKDHSKTSLWAAGYSSRHSRHHLRVCARFQLQGDIARQKCHSGRLSRSTLLPQWHKPVGLIRLNASGPTQLRSPRPNTGRGFPFSDRLPIDD
jgi:hypothetical protein